MAMSSRSAKDRYRPDTVGARSGLTPPACRNHRVPTAGDTPISNAASSERAPCAIAAQNWTRSCRQATVGRPGDGICPRYNCTARCRSRIVPINTSTTEVLRRPVESAQYTAIRFTEHLQLEGITPSVGSVGDAYDNALMESIIGLYKTECVRPGPFHTGPFKTLSEVEFATMAWVDWYNHRRLHATLGMVTPAEREAAYYAALQPEPQPV